MPIGLAAFTRMRNEESQFEIVQDDVHDNSVMKQLKRMIRGMTQALPQNRFVCSFGRRHARRFVGHRSGTYLELHKMLMKFFSTYSYPLKTLFVV